MFKGLLFFAKFCWKSSKRYIMMLFGGNLLSAIQSLGNIILPKFIIDELIGKCRLNSLLIWVGIIVVFNLLCSFFSDWMKNVSFACRIAVNNAFNEEIAEKLSYAPYKRIESADYLDLKQKAEHFIYGNMHGFGYVLDSAAIIICRCISFIGIAAIILSLSPLVLICFVFLVLLCSAAEDWSEKKCNKLYLALSSVERRENYLTNMFTSPTYAKEIRIGNLAPWLLQKEKKHHKEMLSTYITSSNYRTIASAVRSSTSALQQIVSYTYLLHLVLNGSIGIGSFTMYTSAVASFTHSMRDVMKRIIDIRQFKPYYDAASTFLDIGDDVRNIGKEAIPNTNEYTISVNDICFHYPGQETMVINHVSFVWHAGERLSLVGENGSGKTTIVKLLTRMYAPTSGTITLNGVDIQTIAYEEYVKLFSTVFQDFALFAFSLRDNIVAGQEYDEEKMRQAITKSGIEFFVEKMPNGLDTSIHKQFDNYGFEPSGGQAQQIALARALYKDAPIIILDEPSSALDPKVEVNMYTSFDKMIGKKSALYISHRLASCLFCDRILMLEKGSIAESGTHNELMHLNGKYSALFEMQANLYTQNRKESI